MNDKDEGVSEEVKLAVERLCKRLEPKDKENNALWKLVTEICQQNEVDKD
ncbi:hypothetical protein [Bacillus massilinigeriensis]|nr:hypothetical protein [Bacillus massilionigeriensis]